MEGWWEESWTDMLLLQRLYEHDCLGTMVGEWEQSAGLFSNVCWTRRFLTSRDLCCALPSFAPPPGLCMLLLWLQVVRSAHRASEDITSLTFSRVSGADALVRGVLHDTTLLTHLSDAAHHRDCR